MALNADLGLRNVQEFDKVLTLPLKFDSVKAVFALNINMCFIYFDASKCTNKQKDRRVKIKQSRFPRSSFPTNKRLSAMHCFLLNIDFSREETERRRRNSHMLAVGLQDTLVESPVPAGPIHQLFLDEQFSRVLCHGFCNIGPKEALPTPG